MALEINLTKGCVTIVDDEDYYYLSKYKWLAGFNKKKPYAGRTIRVNGKNKTILMHRIIILAKDDEFVDHINGNSLDNRKSNLRIVSKSQNSQNQKGRGQSKYRGVTKDKRAKKNPWRASIVIDKKEIYLGVFPTESEAAHARDLAAKKYKDCHYINLI